MWSRSLLVSMLIVLLAGCRTPEASLPVATLPAPAAVATALSAPRPTLTPVATTPLQQAVATPGPASGTASATGAATRVATPGTPGATGTATRMATPTVIGTIPVVTPASTPGGTGTPRALGTLVAPQAGSGTGAQVFRANINPELGYSLVVPSGWRTETPAGAPSGQISLYSYEPSTGTNPSAPVASNQTKIDIVPLSGMTGRTLAEVMAATTNTSGRVLATRSRDLGGLPALHVDLETPSGPSSAVFVQLGNQPLVIQGYGDLQPFDQIIASFRRV
jgi:hypothetical protein